MSVFHENSFQLERGCLDSPSPSRGEGWARVNFTIRGFYPMGQGVFGVESRCCHQGAFLSNSDAKVIFAAVIFLKKARSGVTSLDLKRIRSNPSQKVNQPAGSRSRTRKVVQIFFCMGEDVGCHEHEEYSQGDHLDAGFPFPPDLLLNPAAVSLEMVPEPVLDEGLLAGETLLLWNQENRIQADFILIQARPF